MVDTVDIEHAKYQIARAQARLEYQKVLIANLPSTVAARSEMREAGILLELQEHLAAALAYHAHLLEELRFRILVYGNVSE